MMMGNAALIAWPHILTTPLVHSIIEVSRSFDIHLQKTEITKQTEPSDLFITMCQYKNVITWVNHGFSFETQNKDRNVLYLENGLLTRGKTFFLDDNGYGNYSNIVSQKYNCKKYPNYIRHLILEKLKNYGFRFEANNFITGKVVIGLQGTGGDENLIEICKKYLPKHSKVVVRPHPGQYKRCLEVFDNTKCAESGFTLDQIICPFDSLASCEALVVNNSALMFKALAMGKKVAACNRGVFSGSEAFLDCSRNPTLLRNIFDFQTNSDATIDLLCGIETQMVSRNATAHDLMQNTNFVNWLIRYRR